MYGFILLVLVIGVLVFVGKLVVFDGSVRFVVMFVRVVRVCCCFVRSVILSKGFKEFCVW